MDGEGDLPVDDLDAGGDDGGDGDVSDEERKGSGGSGVGGGHGEVAAETEEGAGGVDVDSGDVGLLEVHGDGAVVADGGDLGHESPDASVAAAVALEEGGGKAELLERRRRDVEMHEVRRHRRVRRRPRQLVRVRVHTQHLSRGCNTGEDMDRVVGWGTTAHRENQRWN